MKDEVYIRSITVTFKCHAYICTVTLKCHNVQLLYFEVLYTVCVQ